MTDVVVLTGVSGEDAAPLPWAMGLLAAALADRGVTTAGSTPDPAATVRAALEEDGAADPEAFRIASAGGTTTVTAGDPRGLAYGLTELADRVRHADDPVAALVLAAPLDAAPATPVRGVLRAVSSDVLDLGWFRDRDFWTGYLDELAVDRVNRVHLAFGMQYNYSHDPGVVDNYLCFAYPFLLDVPGWDVRVAGVDAAERAANLDALRFASDEAARRGIRFQLGLWNHAVRPELGESPGLRYPITGLDDEAIPAYSAAALGALLRACPGVGGVTFRVHYEGGVPEAGHEAFWSTVLGGVRDAGRPIDVDLHAKGVDAGLLDAALAVGERISLSPKYWAEHQGLPYHQARVRDLERARPDNGDALAGVTTNARRFTRYGYGDFLAADRPYDLVFRVWPGSQRFLLWADPALFAGYGRMSTIGGALGAELCEPLTFRGRKGTGEGPRDLYRDPRLHLPPADDWRKYADEYRLWGRLLYDPDADPEQWRRALRTAYGAAARPVEEALAAAGRVLPLVTVAEGLSASNNYYWPEVVTNLPMFHPGGQQPYDFDTPVPHTWTSASPFDPELFDTADGFAEALLADRATGRVTPVDTASALEGLAATARRAVADARAVGDGRPQLVRTLVDAEILAALAVMYAERIRGGVEVALHLRTGEPARLGEARKRLRSSRAALAEVVRIAAPVYVGDLAFGDRPTERGHWTDRLEQLDAELADLDRRSAAAGEGDPAALVPVPARATAAPLDLRHPGEGRTELVGAPAGSTVRLHVRPLDQSASWSVIDLEPEDDGVVRVDLPDDVSDRYPVQWYLTVHLPSGAAQQLPGLGPELARQPYFVRPAGAAPAGRASRSRTGALAG